MMLDFEQVDLAVPQGPEILSDGVSVWVNAPTGECIARFGRGGVDVHRTVADQVAGMPECLACTHHRPDAAAWAMFVRETARHHGVVIADKHTPRWITGAATVSVGERSRE
ncbi:hypothetical protein [Nitrospirillum amazonense]|uniref:hypothetical protein n=1 Tax=Nitrospirillum amazonense TaxID=28077 RepID=UPI0024122B34|nr:hypothetical protein [Nitrospirillum amazonense]MDG3444613.1 hypothetical protein [Nitrospirillum amazonense]